MRGVIHPSDPAAPDIRFEAGFPARWNRKALHSGGGGLDGVVIPVEMPRPGCRDPLAQGYVVFGSDGGHEMDFSAPADCSWALNDEALENFAHAQLKKTHDAVLWLMQAAYGAAPTETYFVGGSNGGRECMKAIQLYPEDYQGAVCYFPVLWWILKVLADQRNGNAAEALGAEAWIDSEQYAAAQELILAQCDELDGLRDGIVSHLEAAHQRTPQTLEALRATLNDKQLELLRIHSAPISVSYPLGYGPTALPGYNPLEGTALVFGGANAFGAPGNARTAFSVAGADQVLACMVMRDSSFDATHFDPEQWPAEVTRASRLLDAYSPNLDVFFARGGKLILLQGGADNLVTPYGTIQYYHTLADRYGTQLREHMRFYLVPGYGHGFGMPYDPDADLVSALDKWVCGGDAPGTLIAQDRNNPSRARPLYEFPGYPAYHGSGDPDDAANFHAQPLSI